jgi:hypothetical protein
VQGRTSSPGNYGIYGKRGNLFSATWVLGMRRIGPIPTSRPNLRPIPENLNLLIPACEPILEDADSSKSKDGQIDG